MLKIKEAGIESLETLADLWVEFVLDMHPDYNKELMDKIRNATKTYLNELFEKKFIYRLSGAY